MKKNIKTFVSIDIICNVAIKSTIKNNSLNLQSTFDSAVEAKCKKKKKKSLIRLFI